MGRDAIDGSHPHVHGRDLVGPDAVGPLLGHDGERAAALVRFADLMNGGVDVFEQDAALGQLKSFRNCKQERLRWRGGVLGPARRPERR